MRGRIFSESPRFGSHRRDRLVEFGFGVTYAAGERTMVSQERPAASMPMVAVAPSFDRKAEIEEYAAPSAVNFHVLSSREMPLKARSCTQGVTDFLYILLHS